MAIIMMLLVYAVRIALVIALLQLIPDRKTRSRSPLNANVHFHFAKPLAALITVIPSTQFRSSSSRAIKLQTLAHKDSHL